MKIYLICPVRNMNEAQRKYIIRYINNQIALENQVHSYLNVMQDSVTGYEIVISRLEAMQECDEVHIMWDVYSTGSHVDLGMAIALNKKLKIVEVFSDKEGKSYLKATREIIKRQ